MPVRTLQELGFDPNSGVMLGDIGTGAGAFPQPPVMDYIDRQNAARKKALETPPAFRSRAQPKCVLRRVTCCRRCAS